MNTVSLILAGAALVVSLLSVAYNVRLRNRLLRRCRRAESAAAAAELDAAVAWGKLAEMEAQMGGPVPVRRDEPTGMDRLDPGRGG